MKQPFHSPADRWVRMGLVALVVVLAFSANTGQAAPQAVLPGAVLPIAVAEVFNVNCISIQTITSEYAKLTDMGTFTVRSPESLVEVTFNGRISVGNFTSGTGAVFELRIDDVETTMGRARANLRAAEASGGGVPVTITGLFSGLAEGEHTASMWVRASIGGAASNAQLDPGCWSTDVLIVKEYTPLGFTYLPSISRQ